MSSLRTRVEEIVTRYARLGSMTQIERDAVQLIRDLQLELEASDEPLRTAATRLNIALGSLDRMVSSIDRRNTRRMLEEIRNMLTR